MTHLCQPRKSVLEQAVWEPAPGLNWGCSGTEADGKLAISMPGLTRVVHSTACCIQLSISLTMISTLYPS